MQNATLDWFDFFFDFFFFFRSFLAAASASIAAAFWALNTTARKQERASAPVAVQLLLHTAAAGLRFARAAVQVCHTAKDK
jgi:hypothetical protein